MRLVELSSVSAESNAGAVDLTSMGLRLPRWTQSWEREKAPTPGEVVDTAPFLNSLVGWNRIHGL